MLGRNWLVLFFTLLAMGLPYWDGFQDLENLLYGQSSLLLSRPPNEDIVIVAIDESSLREFGRWPWSRRIHAVLINRLTEAGARAVGLDIIFAEPDRQDLGADEILAQAIRDNGHVILPVFPESSDTTEGGQQASLPIPVLSSAAAGLGHVDITPDKNGKIRHIYLEAGTGSQRWKFFPLELLRVGNANLPETLESPDSEVETVQDGQWFHFRRIPIPVIGDPREFKKLSYADLLRGKLEPELLRGKFVLVGSTAAGLGQRFVSPFSGDAAPMAGVQLNAGILAACLQNRLPGDLDGRIGLLLSALLVSVPIWTYRYFGPLRALATLSFGLALAGVASATLLVKAGLWFNPAPAWLALLLSYPVWNWLRLKQTTYSLLAERRDNLATLNSMGEAVIVTDAHGSVEFLNPHAEQLTGHTHGEACGQGIDVILAGLSGNEFATQRPSQWIKKGGNITQPSFLTNRLGEKYTVRLSASHIKDPKSHVSRILIMLNDLSETVEICEQRNFLATHDALTKLPNRILLHERIEKALLHAQHNAGHFAVCFIDLDGFKKINDGLGHDAGDFLLQEISQLLAKNVRHSDTVARWGGDEFVILLDNLPNDDAAMAVAEKILHAMTAPILYQGQLMRVSPSIGISFYPRDGNHAEALLAKADMAMYWVKQQGRNSFCFHTSSLPS